MGGRKYDYESLERQYVQGDMSVRELVRMNGIQSESTVIDFSHRHDWANKRAQWRGRVDAQTEALSAKQAAQRRVRALAVYDKAFDVVERVFDRVIEGLTLRHYVKEHGPEGEEIWVERPLVIIRPNEAAGLIDRMNVLLGRPESITEQRGTINLGDAPPDLLVAILEQSRSEARPVPVGGSPIPRLEGPREAGEPVGV